MPVAQHLRMLDEMHGVDRDEGRDPAISEAAIVTDYDPSKPNTCDEDIEPTDQFYVAYRKRMTHVYVTNDDGTTTLRIDYGLKEIIFEEERLFAFGEQLTQQSSFSGHVATTWGPGYSWEEIRPLLVSLLEEGILKRGDGNDEPPRPGAARSLLPRSVCSLPRSWSLAECESITLDLSGRAIELGYIEAIVPVYRIAHPALDDDDRQVGEANVYPPQLRLERETEWRVCPYSGSRYRSDLPMNITGLKAMIKHWKPIMRILMELRAELGARLERSQGPWAIGDLHLLGCVALALPAFLLLKEGGSSTQLPLHPVVSSMFRITDGIRMTMSEMLFSIEHTGGADEPMSAKELHSQAEQRGVLIGEVGVCAGPVSLIDEFLITAVDGVPADDISESSLPTQVRELLSQLSPAVDYGLQGMQAWGISLSVWLAMSRAYEALLAILDESRPAGCADAFVRLRTRLRADWRILERFQITINHDRDVHLMAYVDAYERSWRALRSPVGAPTLAQAIAPCAEAPVHATTADQLRCILTTRFSGGNRDLAMSTSNVEQLVDVLVFYLREEQAILASTTEILASINVLLDRPRPRRALRVRDLYTSHSMGPGAGAFPYLFDSLEEEFGLRVDCTANDIEVVDKRAA